MHTSSSFMTDLQVGVLVAMGKRICDFSFWHADHTSELIQRQKKKKKRLVCSTKKGKAIVIPQLGKIKYENSKALKFVDMFFSHLNRHLKKVTGTIPCISAEHIWIEA